MVCRTRRNRARGRGPTPAGRDLTEAATRTHESGSQLAELMVIMTRMMPTGSGRRRRGTASHPGRVGPGPDSEAHGLRGSGRLAGRGGNWEALTPQLELLSGWQWTRKD